MEETMNNYEMIAVDTETLGLEPSLHDVVELSLYRLSDDVQKTWLIKPMRIENAQPDALRVNGLKLEDLKGETQYGRDTYKNAKDVIIEIENFVAETNVPTENRCLVAHNVAFDKAMIEQLWKNCDAFDSFPFGRRTMDTMIIELTMDYATGNFAEGYSLKNLAKKYGVKNDKAHSAASDTKCMVEIFRKQIECLKKNLSK